jgi:hypothetical protein
VDVILVGEMRDLVERFARSGGPFCAIWKAKMRDLETKKAALESGFRS